MIKVISYSFIWGGCFFSLISKIKKSKIKKNKNYFQNYIKLVKTSQMIVFFKLFLEIGRLLWM